MGARHPKSGYHLATVVENLATIWLPQMKNLVPNFEKLLATLDKTKSVADAGLPDGLNLGQFSENGLFRKILGFEKFEMALTKKLA